MNTIIVPVDFSETSVNAARYAAGLSHQLSPSKVILYHSILDADQEAVTDAFPLIATAEQELKLLVSELETMAPDVDFEIFVNDGKLLEQVDNLAVDYKGILVVMGITGKNVLQQRIMGSNTIKMVRKSGHAVLIIPSNTTFQPIENIALALQFKERLLEKVPDALIRSITNALHAKLTILNVAGENDDTPPQFVRAGQQSAHLMFDDMDPDYQMLENNNVVQAVLDYVEDHDVQVLMNVSEEHGFLTQLLKGSTTSELAFKIDIPLLVFKAVTS